jgi:hypothetical protein
LLFFEIVFFVFFFLFFIYLSIYTFRTTKLKTYDLIRALFLLFNDCAIVSVLRHIRKRFRNSQSYINLLLLRRISCKYCCLPYIKNEDLVFRSSFQYELLFLTFCFCFSALFLYLISDLTLNLIEFYFESF